MKPEKVVLKLEVDRLNANKNTCTILFVEKPKEEIVPGKPPVRTTRTAVNYVCSDPEMIKRFQPGQKVTITIE